MKIHKFAFGLLVALLLVGVSMASGQGMASSDSTHAVVYPKVTFTLPAVTQLQIGSADLNFDLEKTLNDANQACVLGVDPDDQPGSTAPFGQPEIYPLGTRFRVDWPEIEIEGGTPISSYPPVAVGVDGEVQPGSKTDVICYRSFLLEHRTSMNSWQLSVGRDDSSGSPQIERLYIREVGCRPTAATFGLFRLEDGSQVTLTSNDEAPACSNGHLVVIAVRLQDQLAGKSVANLVYTVVSPGEGWSE